LLGDMDTTGSFNPFAQTRLVLAELLRLIGFVPAKSVTLIPAP
jgi:hypothetical protein